MRPLLIAPLLGVLLAACSLINEVQDYSFDLDVDTARKVLRLLEALDDHDDIQNVSANFNIPDEAMAELAEG